MTGRAVGPQSQYDSRMLNGFIPIIQFGTYRSHIPALAIHQQLFYPVDGNHLCVIIEQQQKLPFRKGSAVIVDAGIIEFSFIRNHADSGMFSDFLVIGTYFLRRAVIFHNDNFIIFIGGFIQYRRNTPAQILIMILIGNENGHFGKTGQLILNAENCLKSPCAGNFKMIHAASTQMIGHSPSGGFNTVQLGADIRCHAGFMGTPVI